MNDWYTETVGHIRRVQALLDDAVANLLLRSREHDASKLTDPEAGVFAEFTAKLKGTTYGSDEYKEFLREMKPALDHHYQFNRHHPEHWSNGVGDMTLLDLLEMLCDWKAATERHADGSLERSFEINQKRFEYGPEIDRLLRRTAVELWPQHRESWHCYGCGNGGARGNFCEMCGAGKNDYVKASTA